MSLIEFCFCFFFGCLVVVGFELVIWFWVCNFGDWGLMVEIVGGGDNSSGGCNGGGWSQWVWAVAVMVGVVVVMVVVVAVDVDSSGCGGQRRERDGGSRWMANKRRR